MNHTNEPIWLPLDAISRNAQIRARSDPQLIAEYAQAMLDGADFPPVEVFEENRNGEVFYHLGDGYHRVDAAALVHAKNRHRRNAIRAKVRPGTFADALRHALQANGKHGKRLEQSDYAHAVRLALEHGLVQVERSSEVVPALMALIPGLSARRASECSASYRRELVMKRNLLIIQLADEGLTQEAIAERLEVDQATVSRIMQNGGIAEMHKPPLPVLRDPATEVTGKRNLMPLLPLLDDPYGSPPPVDDEDACVVAEAPEDPRAVQRLAELTQAADEFLRQATDLTALEGHFTAASGQTTLAAMSRVAEFAGQITNYIVKRDLNEDQRSWETYKQRAAFNRLN